MPMDHQPRRASATARSVLLWRRSENARFLRQLLVAYRGVRCIRFDKQHLPVSGHGLHKSAFPEKVYRSPIGDEHVLVKTIVTCPGLLCAVRFAKGGQIKMVRCGKNAGCFGGVFRLRGEFAQARDDGTIPKLNNRLECSLTDFLVRVGEFSPNGVQRIGIIVHRQLHEFGDALADIVRVILFLNDGRNGDRRLVACDGERYGSGKSFFRRKGRLRLCNRQIPRRFAAFLMVKHP
jgi:hypothetical protein